VTREQAQPPTPATRRIDKLAWHEFESALARTDIALVPIGSVEPHGRHAPLGTDTYIAEEIAERLADRTGALIFPSIPLGSMNTVYDVRGYPGAISIDAELLIKVYANIGTELARNGFRRIVFVNGHGPNAAMLAIAAFKIREAAPVEVGVLDWWTTSGEEVRAIKGVPYGTHADEIETSLVLTTGYADLVDLDAAIPTGDVVQRLSDEQGQLYRSKVTFTRTWDVRWVGKGVNMGDPARATREGGETIVEKAVATGMVLLRALEQEVTATRERRARESS
jgi:creatinine amidohydrolase